MKGYTVDRQEKQLSEPQDNLTVDEVCEILYERLGNPCVKAEIDEWCDPEHCGVECWKRYFEITKKERRK